MSAIVSLLSHNNGIGYRGGLCIKTGHDMKRFKRLTTGRGGGDDTSKLPENLVIMGYSTYKSIPTFPLPGRHNIVITRRHVREIDSLCHSNVTAVGGFAELEEYLDTNRKRYADVWYIGGASIYKEAIRRGLIECVYVTEIECKSSQDPPAADTFFDRGLLDDARIIHTERAPTSDNYVVTYKTYSIANNREEGAYLKLLGRLLSQPLRPSRNGNTRALFAETLRFDIHKNGFPLITTKRMPAKTQTIEKELLFFIRGQTDVTRLQAQGVHIWDGNTTADFLKDKPLGENDMGPLYGFNWRHYGAAYKTCKEDYTGRGCDQLKTMIRTIRGTPFSRRHLITSYNPVTAPSACLYPCHSIIIQCFVREGGFLDMVQYQRSADIFLGVPFNIASSAILMMLIAQQTALEPGRLTIQLGDVHLYETHEEAAAKQLLRRPMAFPTYRIEAQDDIDKYELKHFHLRDYRCHSRIRAPMSV